MYIYWLKLLISGEWRLSTSAPYIGLMCVCVYERARVSWIEIGIACCVQSYVEARVIQGVQVGAQ